MVELIPTFTTVWFAQASWDHKSLNARATPNSFNPLPEHPPCGDRKQGAHSLAKKISKNKTPLLGALGPRGPSPLSGSGGIVPQDCILVKFIFRRSVDASKSSSRNHRIKSQKYFRRPRSPRARREKSAAARPDFALFSAIWPDPPKNSLNRLNQPKSGLF